MGRHSTARPVVIAVPALGDPTDDQYDQRFVCRTLKYIVGRAVKAPLLNPPAPRTEDVFAETFWAASSTSTTRPPRDGNRLSDPYRPAASAVLHGIRAEAG
jgi:hypothetical protein